MARAIEIETFLRYSFPNRVSYSPRGTRAAFVLTTPDEALNRYENSLWRIEGGRAERAFGMGGQRVYRWEDEEHVLFTKREGNGTVLLRGDVTTGETRRLALFPLLINDFQILECGALAALCRTDVNHPDEWRLEKAGREELASRRAAEAAEYRVVDELPFYDNGKPDMVCKQRDSLFLLDVSGGIRERITPPTFQTQFFTVEGDGVYYYGSDFTRKMSVFYELWSYRPGEGARRIYNGGKYNMRGLALWNGRLIMLGTPTRT